MSNCSSSTKHIVSSLHVLLQHKHKDPQVLHKHWLQSQSAEKLLHARWEFFPSRPVDLPSHSHHLFEYTTNLTGSGVCTFDPHLTAPFWGDCGTFRDAASIEKVSHGDGIWEWCPLPVPVWGFCLFFQGAWRAVLNTFTGPDKFIHGWVLDLSFLIFNLPPTEAYLSSLWSPTQYRLFVSQIKIWILEPGFSGQWDRFCSPQHRPWE